MARATSNLSRLILAAVLFAAPFSLSSNAAMLVGVEADTGRLYEISTNDASLIFIGDTGIRELSSLERAPNGVLYGFNVGSEAMLFRIDPETAQASPVGPLGLLAGVFEGGLAFAPDGTAYGTNLGSQTNAQLMRINLLTGHATVIGTIPGIHDINGLAWRSDGMLVGLDRVSNSLLAINPTTAVSSVIVTLNAAVGGVGGMTAMNDKGYFCTAGPCQKEPGIPGSNELYSFDLFSGVCNRIAAFSTNVVENCATDNIRGWGMSGLALVTDPPHMLEPRLDILPLCDGQLLISWKKRHAGYRLEVSVSPPTGNWTLVTNGIWACGDKCSIVIDVESPQRFFRLHKQ